MGSIKKLKKDEKGSFLILTLFFVVGLLMFSGLFLNVSSTYMTVNFSKKAVQESARIRALATDIPLKENIGVLEVINYPYSGSNIYATRPTQAFGGVVIQSASSSEYKEAAKLADDSAKQGMITSLNSFVGNSFKGKKLVEVKKENICFDVKPIQATASEVTFTCALKAEDGKVYTVSHTSSLSGYDDLNKGNKFVDTTLTGNEVEIKVSNAVFAAAVIEPRSFISNAMYDLGFKDHRAQTVIYSIAYPQIDTCYGEFCT